MKRIAFLSIAGGAAVMGRAASSAATMPRLAIAIEADQTVSSDTIRRTQLAITGRILRKGQFQVVDRDRLDAVIREQGFSNSSYADPKTAAAIGKLVGASRILTITLTVEANESSGAYVSTDSVDLNASYSLVGVDSGVIIRAGTAQGSASRQAPAGYSSTPETQLEREAIDAFSDDLASQLGG